MDGIGKSPDRFFFPYSRKREKIGLGTRLAMAASFLTLARPLVLVTGMLCLSGAYAAPLHSYESRGASTAGLKEKLVSSSEQLGLGQDESCEMCRVVSTVLDLYLEGKAREEDVAKLVAQICIILQIEDQNVCDLVVEEFKVWRMQLATVASYNVRQQLAISYELTQLQCLPCKTENVCVQCITESVAI